MGQTPRRHIFKYAKEVLGTHDAPLSPSRSDAGECVFYRNLKFQKGVLDVESFALRLFRMLIAQGRRESRVLPKLMSCPRSTRGSPSQQQRYPVNTANGAPRLLPYQESVRDLAAMKILKTTSRAIGAKFLPREFPSRARRSQGGKRRRGEAAQGDEAACNLAIAGEGDTDFEVIAPAPRDPATDC
jgi:hypothetical protein